MFTCVTLVLLQFALVLDYHYYCYLYLYCYFIVITIAFVIVIGIVVVIIDSLAFKYLELLLATGDSCISIVQVYQPPSILPSLSLSNFETFLDNTLSHCRF